MSCFSYARQQRRELVRCTATSREAPCVVVVFGRLFARNHRMSGRHGTQPSRSMPRLPPSSLELRGLLRRIVSKHFAACAPVGLRGSARAALALGHTLLPRRRGGERSSYSARAWGGESRFAASARTIRRPFRGARVQRTSFPRRLRVLAASTLPPLSFTYRRRHASRAASAT